MTIVRQFVVPDQLRNINSTRHLAVPCEEDLGWVECLVVRPCLREWHGKIVLGLEVSLLDSKLAGSSLHLFHEFDRQSLMSQTVVHAHVVDNHCLDFVVLNNHAFNGARDEGDDLLFVRSLVYYSKA